MSKKKKNKSSRFANLQYMIDCSRFLARKWWWKYSGRKNEIMIFTADDFTLTSANGKVTMLVDALNKRAITILMHPKRGLTCLSRGGITLPWLNKLFQFPRLHTNGQLASHYININDVKRLIGDLPS